jgi:hypothetical protein
VPFEIDFVQLPLRTFDEETDERGFTHLARTSDEQGLPNRGFTPRLKTFHGMALHDSPPILKRP